MSQQQNKIPVYDISSLRAADQQDDLLLAEPFGSYLKAHPNLPLPHRHSFYHIVFFTKGSGWHTIDFERFDVKAGQIYFMIPGQVHSWNFKGIVDGYVINFSSKLFEGFLADERYPERFPFFNGIATDSVIDLSTPDAAIVRTIFKAVIGTLAEGGIHAMDLIRTLMIRLFIQVSKNIEPVAGPHQRPQSQLILHNFRKLVDIHYADKRLPKDYAALLYVTPNHLNALCKDLTGKPAGTLIRDRILLEAKRLLVNADMSMAMIAAKLSFTDGPHFTKFFKKYTDVTPEQFRRDAFNGR